MNQSRHVHQPANGSEQEVVRYLTVWRRDPVGTWKIISNMVF